MILTVNQMLVLHEWNEKRAVSNTKGVGKMVDLKEILKNTVKSFKRAQVIEPESLRKMRVVREAAKEEARKIEAEKG